MFIHRESTYVSLLKMPLKQFGPVLDSHRTGMASEAGGHIHLKQVYGVEFWFAVCPLENEHHELTSLAIDRVL